MSALRPTHTRPDNDRRRVVGDRGFRQCWRHVSGLKAIGGRPAELGASLADRVAELRRGDPLAPINVLVGASLQRPFVERWLAARLAVGSRRW